MDQDYQIPLEKLGQLLADAREKADISQASLAETLGISEVWLSMIENGRGKPSLKLLRRLCEKLGASGILRAALYGNDGASLVREAGDPSMIAIIGHVSAGPSRIAWTDEGLPVGGGDEYVAGNADLRDPHAFALRVRGDSMVPSLRDGDVVIISPRLARVRTGDEALVQMRDGKAYLKAVYPKGDVLILQSVNPAYEPIVVPRSEIRKMMRVVDVRRRR